MQQNIKLINERYALVPGPKTGGMAEVYRAADLNDQGKIVAVKLLTGSLVADSLVKEAFRRETQALRECKHPNIVQLFEAGVEPETGRGYLVLEWMDSNLEEWLSANPGLNWDTFFERVGSPILDALAFAHSRSIAHRDVNPRNVLLCQDGTPKLADFGISKIKRWTEPTVTLNEFASRPYAPPESDGLPR